MKYLIYILVGLTLLPGCTGLKSGQKRAPEWVSARPVNPMYYTGIGVASKSATPTGYTDIAKRNALNDLVSEIRVEVSAQSVLKQYQQDLSFRQQFESETRLSALQSIEQYELAGSWEDKTNYWIYYRLSKSEYEAIRRRKIQAAIDRSEDLFARSLTSDMVTGYTESMRLKIKALQALQDVLNEDLNASLTGHNLVNDILASMQEQLNLLKLSAHPGQIDISNNIKDAGKCTFSARYSRLQDALKGIPIVCKTGSATSSPLFRVTTDQEGMCMADLNTFSARLMSGQLYFMFDMDILLSGDGLNHAVQQLIQGLVVPFSTMNVIARPLVIGFKTNEKSLGKPMESAILEAALKNKLLSDGFRILSGPAEPSVTITLESDTRGIGAIYKTMQAATIKYANTATDNRTGEVIYNEQISDIKGYQTTPENASAEAYKTALGRILSSTYPQLKKALSNP